MQTLTIDQTTIKWDLQNGTCTFNDIPVVSMYVESTFQDMMRTIVDMVGVKRYLLALQQQGRQSIKEDWAVISEHEDLKEGVDALSRSNAVAGWGVISVIAIDENRKEITFRVENSVEGRAQKAQGVCWGSALLAGKCAGYGEQYFKTNCWVEQIRFIADGEPYDEFVVKPSTRSIEKELKKLLQTDEATKEDMALLLKELEKEVKVRRKAENQAKELANIDSLTGLTNRRYFYQKFSRVIDSKFNREDTHGVLCIIDVDDFKGINDSLGHSYGDECLIMVSKRLIEGTQISHGDVSISRIGGDEFAIMLGSLNMSYREAQKQASQFAQNILDKFETPLTLKDKECHIKISMGISVFSPAKSSVESIFKEADMALYKAKQRGKNQFSFFEDDFKEEVNLKFEIINELKSKMKEKRFLLYYQPIVNTERQIVSTEVLARWRNVAGEIVEASDFINLIEVSGHLIQFNQFIVEEACKQLKKWEKKGLSSTFSHLSINISPIFFMHKHFTTFMIETIEKYKVNPRHIMLEITENNILSDFEFAKNKMEILNGFGIQFSLDDFGTGYSSLSYINKLPFSELKIDSSFMENIVEDKRLLSAIIAMAQSMQLSVVAEGIEKEEEFEILKEMGCDLFQGYLFSKAGEALEKI